MTATLLEIVKLMEIFDMKIVEIKFVEIVTGGKFVEIKIRKNKMIYSSGLNIFHQLLLLCYVDYLIGYKFRRL